MKGLISILLYFVAVVSVQGYVETDIACMEAYNDELDNDFLLGEWFFVYKWAGWLNLPASSLCLNVTFTRPTAEEILDYTNHYTDKSIYDVTQNPLKTVAAWYRGVTVGYNEVKFFVLAPDHHMNVNKGYKTQAYKRINDEYILYVNCDLRFNEFWLLSRNEHPTVEELNEIIAGIDEVKRKETQRFCA